MTTPGSNSETTISADNNAEKDDFLQIKGIGQSTAQTLDKLGLSRFSQLIRHTPETLSDLLKTNGLTISPQRIERENWIGQAQEALGLKKTETAGAGRPIFETPWKKMKDWHELADFFVSFGFVITQSGETKLTTRAAHSQSGDDPQDWPDVATDELVAWMMEKAEPVLPPRPQPTSQGDVLNEPAAEAEDSQAPQLSIQRVSQMQLAAAVGGLVLRQVLQVECSLDLPDSYQDLTDRRTSFQIEAYLTDLHTQQPSLVAAKATQLKPGVLNYGLTLEIPQPAVGRYQLYLAAKLQPGGEISTSLRGPVICVE